MTALLTTGTATAQPAPAGRSSVERGAIIGAVIGVAVGAVGGVIVAHMLACHGEDGFGALGHCLVGWTMGFLAGVPAGGGAGAIVGMLVGNPTTTRPARAQRTLVPFASPAPGGAFGGVTLTF